METNSSLDLSASLAVMLDVRDSDWYKGSKDLEHRLLRKVAKVVELLAKIELEKANNISGNDDK